MKTQTVNLQVRIPVALKKRLRLEAARRDGEGGADITPLVIAALEAFIPAEEGAQPKRARA